MVCAYVLFLMCQRIILICQCSTLMCQRSTINVST
jgi:hypothetical protein